MPHDDLVTLLEEALRQPPDVAIPAGFARRVTARAAAAPAPPSVLPYALAAAAVVSLVLISVAPPLPVAHWLAPVLAVIQDPRYCLAVLAAEGTLCLLCLARAARA
jgi:hypothetical protein